MTHQWTQYRHTLTVTTHVEFPLELLAAEGCYPLTADDARAIARSVRADPPVAETVRLTRLTHNDAHPFRLDHWGERHCDVVAVDTKTVPQFTQR